MKKIFLFILLFFGVKLMAQMPPPDTVDIPELEVISSIDILPAGMTRKTIDTLILQNESTVSLSGLLDTHSSIFVKNEGRGALSTVSFRGTAASHTDVFWNGMSVKSPMLGQVDFSLFPVYLYDDISINPGNSSLAETSGALGGTIQLDNKADWSKPLLISFLTGYGSYNTFNNYLKIQRASKRIFSGTRLYFNSSKNDFLFKNKNIATINLETGNYEYPIQKNEHAEYRIAGLEQNFVVRLGKKGVVKANYWFQDSKRSLPRLNTYEGDDYSNINRQKEQAHRAKLEYIRFGKKDKLSVSTGIIVQNLTYTLQNLINGQGYRYAVNSYSTIFSSCNSVSYDYQLSKKSLFKIQYNFDFHHVTTNDSVKKTGYNKNRREHKFLFLWEQQIGSRVSATVLLRKERVNGISVPLIPYAGFNWIVNKRLRWNVRGNIARNFHYPDLNDLYWQPGGNTHLKPEEGTAAELGTQLAIKRGKVSFTPDLTLFYNAINGWILWLPAPAGFWQAQNIKKVVAKGLEISAKVAFAIRRVQCVVQGNYAYTQSLNFGDPATWGKETIGKQLPYIPVHSGNVLISLQWKGFEVNYINNSYSERYTTSTDNLTRRDWLYPYFMNNLYFSKSFTLHKARLKAQLKMYNLFNEEYRSVLGRPMPGRNYMLLLSMNL